jgi:uncharacterized lipoprotein YmbA
MRVGHALAAAGAALALAGCLGDLAALRQPYPEKARYTLEVQRAPDHAVQAGARLADAVLRVRQIHVAPLFERKGFVYRTAESRYESDFYNELYAPPGVVFHQELVDWLRNANLFQQVVGGGSMEVADWLLDVSIDELYADLRDDGRPEAVLSVSIALREAGAARDAEPAVSERYALREPVERVAAEPLVAGWNALMTEAFRRIESALRGYLGRSR